MSLFLYEVVQQVDMWLHLVQVLDIAIYSYLFGTSMIKTDLFESAHIFDLTFSKCLHLLFKVIVAPRSLAWIH